MNAMWELLSRPSSALMVNVAAKSTLILATAAVAALMLRRAPAATRHLAWCLGLCGARATGPGRRLAGLGLVGSAGKYGCDSLLTDTARGRISPSDRRA